jgi:hypothetical protein
MSTNPYAAPKAKVDDAASADTISERPVQVRYASAMLLSSMALGVLNIILEPRLSGGLVGTAVTLVLIGALAGLIYAGYNWARIVYLLLSILGIVPFALALFAVFRFSTAAGLVAVLGELLQIGTLFLIFTRPGSLWFRRARRAAD